MVLFPLQNNFDNVSPSCEVRFLWLIFIIFHKIIKTRKPSGCLPTVIELLRKSLTSVTSQLEQQSGQEKLYQIEEKEGVQMLSTDLVYVSCKSSFKFILKILIFLAKTTVPQNYIGSCDIYFSIPNTERLSFIHSASYEFCIR